MKIEYFQGSDNSSGRQTWGVQRVSQDGSSQREYISPSDTPGWGFFTAEAIDALWDAWGGRMPKPLVISTSMASVQTLDNTPLVGDAPGMGLADWLDRNRNNPAQLYFVNNDDKHWTTLLVLNNVNNSGQNYAIYLDSQGQGQEPLPVLVGSVFYHVYGDTISYCSIPHPEQQQGNCCGMHACLNAIALIEAINDNGLEFVTLSNGTESFLVPNVLPNAEKVLASGGVIDTLHQNARQVIYGGNGKSFTDRGEVWKVFQVHADKIGRDEAQVEAQRNIKKEFLAGLETLCADIEDVELLFELPSKLENIYSRKQGKLVPNKEEFIASVKKLVTFSHTGNYEEKGVLIERELSIALNLDIGENAQNQSHAQELKDLTYLILKSVGEALGKQSDEIPRITTAIPLRTSAPAQTLPSVQVLGAIAAPYSESRSRQQAEFEWQQRNAQYTAYYDSGFDARVGVKETAPLPSFSKGLQTIQQERMKAKEAFALAILSLATQYKAQIQDEDFPDILNRQLSEFFKTHYYQERVRISSGYYYSNNKQEFQRQHDSLEANKAKFITNVHALLTLQPGADLGKIIDGIFSSIDPGRDINATYTEMRKAIGRAIVETAKHPHIADSTVVQINLDGNFNEQLNKVLELPEGTGLMPLDPAGVISREQSQKRDISTGTQQPGDALESSTSWDVERAFTPVSNPKPVSGTLSPAVSTPSGELIDLDPDNISLGGVQSNASTPRVRLRVSPSIFPTFGDDGKEGFIPLDSEEVVSARWSSNASTSGSIDIVAAYPHSTTNFELNPDELPSPVMPTTRDTSSKAGTSQPDITLEDAIKWFSGKIYALGGQYRTFKKQGGELSEYDKELTLQLKGVHSVYEIAVEKQEKFDNSVKYILGLDEEGKRFGGETNNEIDSHLECILSCVGITKLSLLKNQLVIAVNAADLKLYYDNERAEPIGDIYEGHSDSIKPLSRKKHSKKGNDTHKRLISTFANTVVFYHTEDLTKSEMMLELLVTCSTDALAKADFSSGTDKEALDIISSAIISSYPYLRDAVGAALKHASEQAQQRGTPVVTGVISPSITRRPRPSTSRQPYTDEATHNAVREKQWEFEQAIYQAGNLYRDYESEDKQHYKKALRAKLDTVYINHNIEEAKQQAGMDYITFLLENEQFSTIPSQRSAFDSLRSVNLDKLYSDIQTAVTEVNHSMAEGKKAASATPRINLNREFAAVDDKQPRQVKSGISRSQRSATEVVEMIMPFSGGVREKTNILLPQDNADDPSQSTVVLGYSSEMTTLNPDSTVVLGHADSSFSEPFRLQPQQALDSSSIAFQKTMKRVQPPASSPEPQPNVVSDEDSFTSIPATYVPPEALRSPPPPPPPTSCSSNTGSNVHSNFPPDSVSLRVDSRDAEGRSTSIRALNIPTGSRVNIEPEVASIAAGLGKFFAASSSAKPAAPAFNRGPSPVGVDAIDREMTRQQCDTAFIEATSNLRRSLSSLNSSEKRVVHLVRTFIDTQNSPSKLCPQEYAGIGIEIKGLQVLESLAGNGIKQGDRLAAIYVDAVKLREMGLDSKDAAIEENSGAYRIDLQKIEERQGNAGVEKIMMHAARGIPDTQVRLDVKQADNAIKQLTVTRKFIQGVENGRLESFTRISEVKRPSYELQQLARNIERELALGKAVSR